MIQPLLVFDGVCNLCNASVDFIIKHDPDKRIKFVAAQTERGRRVLDSLGIDSESFDSVLFVENDRVHIKSTAVLRVAGHLAGAWRWLTLLLLIPKPIRDRVYGLIARNRHRWFGQRDTCRLPTQDFQDRFLQSID